jgi:hypothetical protein
MTGKNKGLTLKKFMRKAKLPYQLSWKETSEKVADFLRQNVLEKIQAVPEYEGQATTPPEPIPYPEQMGPVYTWITAKRAEKLEITNGDPTKLYPHERVIRGGGRRLASLGVHGDFPKEAHNGFTWCGIGEAQPNTPAKQYEIQGHHKDSEFGDYTNKLI